MFSLFRRCLIIFPFVIMLFVFVYDNSLTLSFAVYPFTFKCLSIWIRKFSNAVFDIVFIDTLKLRVISPPVNSITVLFTIQKISFKHLPILVYDSTFSIYLIVLKSAFIIEIWTCIFPNSMLYSIDELAFIRYCDIIFAPCFNSFTIW